jgi:nucleoporin NUP2
VRHLESELRSHPSGDFLPIFRQYIDYRATILKEHQDSLRGETTFPVQNFPLATGSSTMGFNSSLSTPTQPMRFPSTTNFPLMPTYHQEASSLGSTVPPRSVGSAMTPASESFPSSTAGTSSLKPTQLIPPPSNVSFGSQSSLSGKPSNLVSVSSTTIPTSTDSRNVTLPSKTIKHGGGDYDNEDGEEESQEVKNDEEGPLSDPSLLRTGAGEEQEVTLHEVRIKLFLLKDNAYTDLGIGLFKINLNRISQKKRILCRAEGTGKVLINTYLNSSIGVKYESGKKDVMIMCIQSDGQPAKYLIRLKTSESAQALQRMLDEHKRT